MAFSAIGVTRFKVYGLLLLVNTIVLGLSAHINHFQEFYYKADVLPFVLSLTTMFFVLVMIFLDFNSSNTFTAYPAFELTWLFLTGMIWLVFNAFSSSRWRYVNFNLCGTIPGDSQYAPYRTWCHEIQALRALVWIEWVILLLTFTYIFRWAFHQHAKGRTDVWTKSISRLPQDEDNVSEKGYVARSNSEFLQFEGFPSPSASEPQHDGTGARAAAARIGAAAAEPQFEFIAPAVPQQYGAREGGQFTFPPKGPYAKQLHVQTYPGNGAVTPDPFASPLDYAHSHTRERSPSPAPPPSADRLIYPTNRAGAGIGGRSQQPHPYASVYIGKDASAPSPIKTKFAQAQAQGQVQGQSELRYGSSERLV